jgi:2-C-methyl-D-erythritol 4-phosphate cytidylyltransferase
MQASVRYWAILAAAGKGTRMGIDIPKQYCVLRERTVIEHTLATLLACALIEKIVVVLNRDDTQWQKLASAAHTKILTTLGGEQRTQSILNGLIALNGIAKPHDWVLVHDAARPCLSSSDLQKLIDTLEDHPVGGLLGARVRDTLKRSDANNDIIATVDRQDLWHALTPQMFRYGLLQEALQKVASDATITDDAAAIERLGKKPLMVEGRVDNIKITRYDDLALAENYLLLQGEQ